MATRRRRRAAPRPGLLNVNGHTEPSSGSDVLRALKVTTHAILAVWNYLLSLPNEHGYTQPRQHFRPTSLSTRRSGASPQAQIAPTRSHTSDARHSTCSPSYANWRRACA